MPELPEVETIVRGIRPLLIEKKIVDWTFYREDLRHPIPIGKIKQHLVGSSVTSVLRRSKYIILETENGRALIHLGMTGNLIFRKTNTPQVNHTHFVIHYQNPETGELGYLHYSDPRRFGSCGFLSPQSPLGDAPELCRLGPEPLDQETDLGEHLWHASRSRKIAVKPFLMDAHVVVGVGNIYASESLFLSRINPKRPANKISKARYVELAMNIRKTLRRAIKAGGTTLRDFQSAKGETGYFRVKLAVYDREGESCGICGSKVKSIRQAGRSSFYCPRCQKN